MNDDWNLVPDRSIKDIKIWWAKENGRQFYDADFAKYFTNDYCKVGYSTVYDKLGVDQQAMVNAGDIEFNSDGNDVKFENLQRISAADSPVKYVFYKHDEATGTDAVDNGFEAGQIHKCTVFHNVLPRVKPASVETISTSSFCCIGFGVRKTGNDGTIEQYDVCEG